MPIVKHGGCGTHLYDVWKSMRQRCYNNNSYDYKWYGGLGIKICDEWNDFSKFREWAVKNGYKRGLTIERINGMSDYCPDNCAWITIQEQQKNRKNVLRYEYNGELHTVDELCKISGISKSTFYDRKHKGWTIERIITTPKVEKVGGYRPKGSVVYHG